MTYRFTLRALLIGISFASCLFACLFLPGGMYIHLPLMVMCLLAVIAARAAVCLCCGYLDRVQLHRHRRKLLGSALLFVLVGALYFPFFGIAVQKAKRSQLAAAQKRALLNVDDPIRIRDAARRLYQQVIHLRPEDRRIDGNSNAIPKDLASLHPTCVTVHQNSIFVEMCCTPNDWFGLLVYPEGSAEVGGDYKLDDGIWYWETP